MDGDDVDGPTLAEEDATDDGYVPQEFDLEATSEHDDPPPQQRHKCTRMGRKDPYAQGSRLTAPADEEALVLALLRVR